MRRSHILASVTIAFLLTAGACATTGGAGGTSTSSSSTRITKPEITATSASSAYDVVSQLHPDWLRPPSSSMTGVLGSTQSGPARVRTPLILVYLDGVRLGGVDELRSLSTASVMSIEYADSNRVSTVVRDIGSVTPDAVIMVSTKK